MQLQKEMNQNSPAIKKCAAPKKYSRSQNKAGWNDHGFLVFEYSLEITIEYSRIL